MKFRRGLLAGIGVILGLALYVVGIVILPDKISMQIQADGSLGNIMNKYLGLIVPLLMTAGGAIVYYQEEHKWALPLSLLGIGMYIFTFWVNLR